MGDERERPPLGGWPISPSFVGPLPRCACGYSPLACKGGAAHESRVRDRLWADLGASFDE